MGLEPDLAFDPDKEQVGKHYMKLTSNPMGHVMIQMTGGASIHQEYDSITTLLLHDPPTTRPGNPVEAFLVSLPQAPTRAGA